MGAVEKERDRRQYGSGSVAQRSDGIWVGRIENGFDRAGKRDRIYVYATTESRCKTKLENKKIEIARHGAGEKGARKRLTIGQWAEQWLEVAVDELAPASYNASASAVRKWIVPTIGRRRLNQVAPADFRAIYASLRKAERKQASFIRTHAVLTKMLKDAVREGHEVPQAALLMKRPDDAETDRMAISFEDAMKLLAVVGQRPDASLWAGFLLQGLRQGEALGLTWDCVDFESGRLRVDWQLKNLPYRDTLNKHLGFRVPDGYTARHLDQSFHLVRPKSKTSRRTIPMTPWMVAALKTWREIAPPNEHGLVWPSEDGSPQWADDNRGMWKALQLAAGIQHPAGRPYHLHEARHATATILLELGVDKDVVREILGHSKFIEAYDHADRLPEVKAALERLATHLALVA